MSFAPRPVIDTVQSAPIEARTPYDPAGLPEDDDHGCHLFRLPDPLTDRTRLTAAGPHRRACWFPGIAWSLRKRRGQAQAQDTEEEEYRRSDSHLSTLTTSTTPLPASTTAGNVQR